VQKFAKLSIIQPAIARFRSKFVDFDHVTLDVPRTFNVNGDITYQHHKKTQTRYQHRQSRSSSALYRRGGLVSK